MPFLDHLEELRTRLIRSLAVLVAGVVLGLWAVQRFQLVSLLKAPIAQYLPTGKLTVLSPTEPVMIVLKLGFSAGLVLASPFILWQLWGFLSPALYAREKRAVLPALLVGLLLFLFGATVGYLFVVPQALRVLFSFQSEALSPMITYGAYFDFVLQVVLALGLSFELPLVMILLAALGLISPPGINRFRRFAIVLACIAGAILSPGTDVISMLMMTIPLLILYEVGFVGSVVVERRRRRSTATVAGLLLLLCLAPGTLQAQEPTTRPPKPGAGAPAPPDTLRDSTRARPGQPLDTASARRLGLPTGPSQSFPEPDSVIRRLLGLPGYQITRYRSDSATLFGQDRRILLGGRAMTEQAGDILEAGRIAYQESSCMLDAGEDPRLFANGKVLAGESLRYDTCVRRGVVTQALTTFQQGGTNWFLRGNLAQDSSSSRLYSAFSEITSCDLPVTHYHFAAREVKWISNVVLVGRPAVLYVRDVPILWLPFIFQDARPGRHSGILVPHFGINDIVRANPSYSRQVTNVGYYWAPNDYMDVTARLDWYANRYVQYGASGQYRWLDRFLTGSLAYNRQAESQGSSGYNIRWDHQQNFNLTTSLNLDFNYSSNTAVVNRNAVDPTRTTQLISSSLNFSKRLPWGSLTLGGSRQQSLSDGSVSLQFPTVSLSPRPIDIGPSVTWSPALNFSQTRQTHFPSGDIFKPTVDSRNVSANLSTPFRFGGFNWNNSVSVSDFETNARLVESFRVPDPGNPGDSLTATRVTKGSFSTGVDWQTGINLPSLLRRTWRVQPVVGVANITSGPFLLRNQNTSGQYVVQGKRFSLAVSASPTFFAFFPGFGPLTRIRHSISPLLSWSYSPQAQVPREYARALAGPGRPLTLTSPATQLATLTLSQNFEGKLRRRANDTTATAEDRKLRLLSLSTSPFSYDFEQARLPGRTGWRTASLSNTFQSDLIPNFNLSLTHDLWRGVVGTDTAKFSPFLTSVSASFALSAGTIRTLGSLLGLGSGEGGRPGEAAPPSSYKADLGRGRPGTFENGPIGGYRNRQSFTANVNYSLSRSRPVPGVPPRPTQQSIGFSTSFSPTAFWSLSWSTQYNVTDSRFESQLVRLERDLHDWRAAFDFAKNTNGNFALYFSIYLLDLPAIKFDYNQTTLEQ